jgi:hypothetical protein
LPVALIAILSKAGSFIFLNSEGFKWKCKDSPWVQDKLNNIIHEISQSWWDLHEKLTDVTLDSASTHFTLHVLILDKYPSCETLPQCVLLGQVLSQVV